MIECVYVRKREIQIDTRDRLNLEMCSEMRESDMIVNIRDKPRGGERERERERERDRERDHQEQQLLPANSTVKVNPITTIVPNVLVYAIQCILIHTSLGFVVIQSLDRREGVGADVTMLSQD